MSSSFRLKSHPNRILYDHLKCVAESSHRIISDLYPKLKTSVLYEDLQKCSFIIGATHDIGKATGFFQSYLFGKTPDNTLLKSHSMISSMYASWILMNDPQITKENRDFLSLASGIAIQGHHGSLKRPTNYLKGLGTFYDQEIFSKQMDTLSELKEIRTITNNLGLESFDQFAKSWQEYFFELRKKLIKSSWCVRNFDDWREPYFLINLLYSTLLDADRMDASGLSFSRTSIRTNAAEKFVRKLEGQKAEPIDRFRKLLFDNLDMTSRTIDLDPKILSITAQTGLGKTLSSMNFALNLRERISSKKGYSPRIIYVAPFISILDQNMKVLQNVFQSDVQSNVLLMHHHLSPLTYTRTLTEEMAAETYSTARSELLIQGWNSEVIVTTFIQFFDTIFGRYTSQLRRLHNLAGSIIILDEVQCVPFEYWEAVRNALLFFTRNLGCYVIFMTATQPLIFAEGEMMELVPHGLLSLPERVTFNLRNEQQVGIVEFSSEMNSLISKYPDKSILIELNTIKSAIEVYRLIANSERPYFLSSQIIPKIRGPRIDIIKKNLENSKRVILVCTQVVEAGVDIDFDIAVRDIGPIDAIVQTAGRCNRNGTKQPENSLFFIYRLINEDGRQFARKIYGRVAIDVSESIINKEHSIFDLVNQYYREIRTRRSNLESVKINADIKELNYEDVEENFKLIDEPFKAPVFVEFDDHATKVWTDFVNFSNEERVNRSRFLEIMHEMEQYMIGISRKDVEKAGLVEFSGIFKLDSNDIGRLYDTNVGFSVE
jgi:CRISPR-associated endonuclease/helicase Cas3